MTDAVDVLLNAWGATCEDQMPRVVRIEAESGLGKTFALQRAHDTLASMLGGYFAPGLCPTTIPLRRDLDTTRRRLCDASLLTPESAPAWMWLAVSCIPSSLAAANLGRDRQVGQLADQLAFHVAHLLATYEKMTAGADLARRLAKFLGRFVTVPLGPVLGLIRGVIGAGADAKEAWEALARFRQHQGESDPEGDLEDSMRRDVIRLLGRFDGTQRWEPIPRFMVVDDAHQASEELIDVLSAVLRSDPNEFPPEGRYLGVGEPGSHRSLLIAVASQPSMLPGTPVSRWLDDVAGRTAMLWPEVARPGPGMARPTAQQYISRHVSWLSTSPQRDRLLRHLEAERPYSNPLMLTEALATLTETVLTKDPDDVTDEFIESLPTTPTEAGRRRFESLEPDCRAGVVMAAGVGPRFPPRVPVDLIEALDFLRFRTVVDRHHYCVVSPGAIRWDPRGLGADLFEAWEFADDQAWGFARAQFADTAGPYTWVQRSLLEDGATYLVRIAQHLRSDLRQGSVSPSLHQLGQVVAPLARVVLQESLNGSLLEQFARVLSQTDLTRSRRDPSLLPDDDVVLAAEGRTLGESAEFVRLWVRFFAQVFKARSFPDSVLRSFMAEVEQVAPRSRLAVYVASAVLDSPEAGDQARLASEGSLDTNRLFLGAALRLARHVAPTDRERARQLLEPHAHSSARAAVDLVELYYWPQGEKHPRESDERRTTLEPAVAILRRTTNQPTRSGKAGERSTRTGSRMG